MSDTYRIELARLQQAMHLLVRGFGSAPAEVEAVVGNLVDANLTGHDSHGIGMLPRYAKAYLEGGLKPNTAVRVVHDGGSLLRLDGDAGFGQVIGAQAMALGIERARGHGSCIVALGNAHRLGRIGAWAEQVAHFWRGGGRLHRAGNPGRGSPPGCGARPAERRRRSGPRLNLPGPSR